MCVCGVVLVESRENMNLVRITLVKAHMIFTSTLKTCNVHFSPGFSPLLSWRDCFAEGFVTHTKKVRTSLAKKKKLSADACQQRKWWPIFLPMLALFWAADFAIKQMRHRHLPPDEVEEFYAIIQNARKK